MNVISILLYLINIWLNNHTKKGQINIFLTVISILGGTLGILSAILIFDRKPKKGSMMLKVFIAAVFVIQTVILLIIKGHISDNITFSIYPFLENHKIIPIYLAIINIITFAAFAADKFNAANHKSRIRIVTLLGLAFIGGSIGGLAAMYIFKHKTQKNYFTVGIPIIMIMQIVVLFYAMNISV